MDVRMPDQTPNTGGCNPSRTLALCNFW